MEGRNTREEIEEMLPTVSNVKVLIKNQNNSKCGSCNTKKLNKYQ